ncbi:MAG: hypothetical protein OXJ36_00010 [bacterium]|nr:hypothetical protein [bacterium]MDE0436779.1 hypothetical protein [bacterium]
MTLRGRSGKEITLRDIHKPHGKVFGVDASNSVSDTIRFMDQYNVDQVLVVDPLSEDRWMIVTRRMIAAALLFEFGDNPVKDLLESSEDPRRWLPASTPLAAAAGELIEHDWVITTDSHGAPEGLATVGDALKEAIKLLNTSP